MIDEARPLYEVAPKEFVAARNGLVKELKAAGRKDDAAAVAALRRPRLPEYALNLAARRTTDDVDRFVRAVEATAAAQRHAIERGEGGTLRTATDELRRASAALTDGAVAALEESGERGEAQRAEIGDLLRSFVTGRGLDQLRAGVVGSTDGDDEVDGDDGAGSIVVPIQSRRRTKPSPTRPMRPPAPDERRLGPTLEERREQQRRENERAGERRRLDAAVRAARTQLAARERDVERAESALRDAKEALTDARTRAEAARDELTAATDQRDALD